MLSAAQVTALGQHAQKLLQMRYTSTALQHRRPWFRRSPCSSSSIARGIRHHRRMRTITIMAEKDGKRSSALAYPPANAEDAIERGLKVP
jgi:hypothetical protein